MLSCARVGFLLFVMMGAATLPAAQVTAQDWTRFRGPNGTGVVEGVSFPTSWSDDDYSWKIDLPGIGHSSPVVYGDTAFLMSADSQTAKRYVLAVNLKSGDLRWKREFTSETHRLHDRNTFGSSTPAVNEDAVFVAWSSPQETILKALSHDGDELWTRDLGTWVSQHGFGTSPIVYQDRVILFNSQQKDQVPPNATPGTSRMMAFDAESGKTLWETPTNATRVCYSVPCIRSTSAGNDELVCCNTGNGIFGMDLDTGKINWEISVFDKRCVASPVVAGELVLGSCGSGGGGNILVAVRAGPNPTEVYRVRSNANYVPTPVVHRNRAYLFGDKGVVSCIDAKSGESIWRERISAGFSGSPICIDGKVYCVDEAGTMHILETGRQFEALGTVDLGETCRSTPTVANGLMLIRTDSQLRALRAK